MNSRQFTPIARLWSRWLGLTLLAMVPLLGWGQVNLTGASPSYSQTFDALPTTGSTTVFTDNSTITGVYAQRSGTGNTIVASDGSSNAGNLYSFGTGTATDRALGSTGSSNAAVGGLAYGIQFRNTTANSITSLSVTYTGEQWRNGGVAAVQVIDFSYQVSATAVTSLSPTAAALAAGTTTGNTPSGFTAVPALNFTSPTTSATAAALNGNAAANRTTLTATITVNIPVNSYIMLRWGDPDHNSSDHGLSIDDFSASFTNAAPATPTLNASTSTLSAFSTLVGSASTAQSYTLTGSSLTANVTVTPPAGYEVSQTSATTGFAGSATAISVAQTGGNASATIYVRLTGATAGTPSGNVTNTSTGAAPLNVAVTGTVVGKPTGTPAISSVSPSFNSATLNLTAADGTNLLVVVRPASSSATAPTDQTTYTANTIYGAGTALGSGYTVFATANAASVTVSGLAQNTAYAADIYTYNVGAANGFESYGTSSGTTTFTTPTQPPAVAGQLALEENFDYANGTQLANSQTVASTTTGWLQNGTTTTNPITTATGNLNSISHQYPQGVLAATPAGTSTDVPLTTSGQDVYKTFAQPTGATAVYAAALLTVNSAQSSDYFLHFISGAVPGSATNFRGRVYAKTVSGTTFNFGLTMGNETPVNYGATAYTIGTTYLVVLKYENSAATGSLDAATLFVLDPATVPVAEPTAAIGPINTGATALQTTLNAIGLRQGTAGSAPTVTVDALRIASGWGAAVGRPVYTTAANTIVAGDYYSLRVAGSGSQVSTSGTVLLEKQLNLDGGQVATSTANPLVLRARNVIGDSFEVLTNGGTSYVDGPVSREAVGGPSLLFPVGRNGNYRPMTLNISTASPGTTTYTGVQTDASAYSADATVDAALVRVSQVRYFSITPSPVPAAGVFTGTLELSFGSDDGVNDPSQGTLVVAKSDGAGWASIGRSSNSATSVTSSAFQDFSNFSLASSSVDPTINPLPVELTRFTATRGQTGVKLSWATASEKNSAFFEVQRRNDGGESTFATIAKVTAHGSSSAPQTYTALDPNLSDGTVYYRLRQVDLDGSARYSDVVVVKANATNTAVPLSFYPNPATDAVTVNNISLNGQTVRILDLTGRELRRSTVAADGQVSLRELPAGTYLLQVQDGASLATRRITKQ